MAAIDEFRGNSPGLTTPATLAEAITPSDATQLGYITRALYVGTGGDAVVAFADDPTTFVTLKGLSAGQAYPLRLVQVKASGTTAADLVGLR